MFKAIYQINIYCDNVSKIHNKDKNNKTEKEKNTKRN